MTEINMRLQGVSDPEINAFSANDVDSDGNISLATSEPPLENIPTCDFQDYANMTRRHSTHVQNFGENNLLTSDSSLNLRVHNRGNSLKANSEKSLNLGFRSLVDLTVNDEATLENMKALSVENLTKFGKDSKEYEAYFPDDQAPLKPPRSFLTNGPETDSQTELKQFMVGQANDEDIFDNNTHSALTSKNLEQSSGNLELRRSFEQFTRASSSGSDQQGQGHSQVQRQNLDIGQGQISGDGQSQGQSHTQGQGHSQGQRQHLDIGQGQNNGDGQSQGLSHTQGQDQSQGQGQITKPRKDRRRRNRSGTDGDLAAAIRKRQNESKIANETNA